MNIPKYSDDGRKKSLRKKYEKIVKDYIKLFSKKHEIELDFWVADQIGTVASFGDYFFDFETIRLDLDYDVPPEHLFRWYEHSLEEHVKSGCTMNYYTYLSKTIRDEGVIKRLQTKQK